MFNCVKPFFHSADIRAFRHLKPDFFHRLFEKLSVFSLFYRMKFCADEFNLMLFKRPAFSKLNSEIKRSLPAHCRKKRIRPFFLYYQLNDVCRQRLNVGCVGNLRVCHNCCRIGIDKNYFIAFFAQRLARLSSGIVKLARLSYDNRPRAD